MNSYTQYLKVRVLSEKLTVKLPPFCVLASRVSLGLGRTASLDAGLFPPLPPFGGRHESIRGIRRWEDLAKPVVVPLAAAEEPPSHQPHPAVTGLLVRSPASAIPERDPVVDPVEPHFPPRAIGAQADRLGRDARAIEVMPADEDAALAIARDPVDVEESGHPDRLVAVRDRPVHAVRVVGLPLGALPDLRVAEVADAPAPEPRGLRLAHPGDQLLRVAERGHAERDAVRALEPRSEHLALLLLAERRVLAFVRPALLPGVALYLIEVLVDVRAVAVVDTVPVPKPDVAELLEDVLAAEVVGGDAVDHRHPQVHEVEDPTVQRQRRVPPVAPALLVRIDDELLEADELRVRRAVETEPRVADARAARVDGPHDRRLVLRLLGPPLLPCRGRRRLVPAADRSGPADAHVRGPPLVRVEIRLDRHPERRRPAADRPTEHGAMVVRTRRAGGSRTPRRRPARCARRSSRRGPERSPARSRGRGRRRRAPRHCRRARSERRACARVPAAGRRPRRAPARRPRRSRARRSRGPSCRAANA